MKLILFGCIVVCQFSSVAQGSLFSSLSSEFSGIDFSNNIKEDEEVNIMKYDYLYNGGGVGVGDFDKNGLPDLFFAGNMVSDKLYMNLGGMHFQDATEESGIESNGWSGGVCVFDANDDGYDDIYVLRSGPSQAEADLVNVLYVNQKDGTFKEEAQKYGLNLVDHHTQAAPLDFDLDGDLDLYIMGHPGEFQHEADFQQLIHNIQTGAVESDKLMENVNGKFIDITKEAGIVEYGYGLGLAVTDINLDGFPDIIVCNDFDEPDHIFVNQQNSTFLDQNQIYFKHTANYSMGNDVGDINNDGLLDYISVDMAFESHERSKKNMASMNPKKFFTRVQVGWGYQYMHNMLQLNTGMGSFQEISQIAGISKTDWSWAPLFMDVDMDGYQDLFITNGYKRDTKNNDISYNLKKIKDKKGEVQLQEFLDLIPSVRIENFFFRNKGDLTFEDKRSGWGVDEKLNSNGAAYADLDLDGDLDLILNNVDTLASIYENKCNNDYRLFVIDLIKMKESDYSGLKFKMYTSAGIQVREGYFVRGYCSTVEKKVSFYLPKTEAFERLEIIKSDGSRWLMSGLEDKTRLELSKDLDGFSEVKGLKEMKVLFEEVTLDYKLEVPYVENNYNDFETESLLPHQLSTNGPAIQVADIDNNGLDDFVISASKDQLTGVYLQRTTGTFTKKFSPSFYNHQASEDVGLTLLDVNGDKKTDLIVSSGGYEFPQGDTLLQNRLYIGNGTGMFGLVTNAMPEELSNSGKVVPQDIDGDGDQDLLICGETSPKKYPYAGYTKIYMNERGYFRDKTSKIAPQLEQLGIVKDVVFSDIDSDGDEDLLVVGEWMSIEIFENTSGTFVKRNKSLDLNGWWTTIKAVDIDGDGDEDYVLGNAGMNNKYRPSSTFPLEIYANDFDDNGTLDIVLAYNKKGYQIPVRGRECSSFQMPFISDKFPTFDLFANSNLEQIYGKDKLESSLHFKVTEFRSGILYNNGKEDLEFTPFPIEGQLSFLNDFEILDINNDQLLDIVGVGNRFNTEVETSRYDANCGVVFIQKPEGGFDFLPAIESGFYAPHNAKSIEKINLGSENEIGFLIGNNNQYVQLFKLVSN